MPERHTTSIFQQKVTLKRKTNTSQDGVNILGLCKDSCLPLTSTRCAAHMMQLAVHDALKQPEVNAVIEVAGSVTKKLQKLILCAFAKQWYRKRPVLDVEVRWMSIRGMLTSVLPIRGLTEELGLAMLGLCLDNKVWGTICEVKVSRQPLKLVTPQLCIFMYETAEFIHIRICCVYACI